MFQKNSVFNKLDRLIFFIASKWSSLLNKMSNFTRNFYGRLKLVNNFWAYSTHCIFSINCEEMTGFTHLLRHLRQKKFYRIEPWTWETRIKTRIWNKDFRTQKTLLRVVYATDLVVRFCDLLNMHASILTMEQCALKM